jgi:hypothetical protein
MRHLGVAPSTSCLLPWRQTPRLVEKGKLMFLHIEKQIGRTLAEAPKKSRETILGAAEVLALALTVGLVGLCIVLVLFMIAII